MVDAARVNRLTEKCGKDREALGCKYAAAAELERAGIVCRTDEQRCDLAVDIWF
jgi:hypothetical protein